MKTVILALLATVSASAPPALALAQAGPPAPSTPSARNGLTEQLARLSARIDHRLARGRLSQAQADRGRREINDLQAEAGDDRLKNGGQISEADRFGLEARINRLRDEVEAKRAPGA